LRAVVDHDMTPFNGIERLVIELADAMTDTPANVSDDLYERLRNQFSEEQLMQLGGQIAFENYRARWNRIFNVESRVNGLRAGRLQYPLIRGDGARPPSACKSRDETT